MDPDTQLRRSFLTRLNRGAAALAGMAGIAMAQPQKMLDAARWQPARHDKDDWLDANRAKHRVVFDTTASDGLREALAYASNFYMANSNGYSVGDAELAVLIILRHRSAAFGYTDAMWAKYGEPIAGRIKLEDPKTMAAPKSNLHVAELDRLAMLGAQFAVCEMSTHAFASTIADKTGGKAEEVFAELGANLLKNARLVPAGIVAVNRAQERGYTLMS
jgi:intracellular sulfur oxidation DsrE/DsrF family protein